MYRSPLLRELIDCCDVALPRVEEVSWPAWTELGDGAVGRVLGRIQVVDEADAEDGFAIWFTRPVRADTLTPASVVLSRPHPAQVGRLLEGGPRADRRCAPWRSRASSPAACSWSPDTEWLDNEIIDKRSSLDDGFRLEITIRGQLVRDECGHMLDAVPTDVGCAPARAAPVTT